MGALADAALAAGARVYGVIPSSMVERELAHPGLTELVVVGSMHERKAEMSRRVDAFIALPGGFGTLDETFEALTWTQIGIHAKPVALLDVEEYWAPLVAWIDRAVSDGFVQPEDRAMLVVERDANRALDALGRACVP
jgi:uncharacterized protein (TIGR00730 family)